MEKIILVVFFIVFILYFLYLVRVFVFSFKKYRKTMRLNKAIIFSFLNTFRHAIIIEYGATIDPKERYWMKLIKSLLVLIILLNSTIVNVSAFKNDLINRDETTRFDTQLQDFQENRLTLDSLLISKVDNELQPLSLTWVAVVSYLLLYFPTAYTGIQTFMNGLQTRGGAPGIFGGLNILLQDNFWNYSNTSNYWSNFDAGCVLHTRTTWLCPYKTSY